MAVEKVTMPQLGESVTEGTISSWLVKAGDQVNKYDPIAEVETDKVNAEVLLLLRVQSKRLWLKKEKRSKLASLFVIWKLNQLVRIQPQRKK